MLPVQQQSAEWGGLWRIANGLGADMIREDCNGETLEGKRNNQIMMLGVRPRI
jgi:hypothetical protein